jgi:hypothetical protein
MSKKIAIIVGNFLTTGTMVVLVTLWMLIGLSGGTGIYTYFTHELGVIVFIGSLILVGLLWSISFLYISSKRGKRHSLVDGIVVFVLSFLVPLFWLLPGAILTVTK